MRLGQRCLWRHYRGRGGSGVAAAVSFQPRWTSLAWSFHLFRLPKAAVP
jgi:hypothetical protein